jgi:anti-sigma B factor antagonist
VTDRTLTVTVDPGPPGLTVLRVVGELDQHTAPRLREALDAVPFTAGTAVVLDVTGLVYCDSTGITVFLAADQHAQSIGCSLSLAGSNEDLMRMFRILAIDTVLSLHPTVEHAVDAGRR